MARSAIIGLDIGSTHVRAAEIQGSAAPGRGTPVLVRYGEVPLPLGAVRDGEVQDARPVSAALRQLWSQGKFSSRDVVMGVGNQRVVVRDLDMAWMPLAQIRVSLPYQVQEILPMAGDEALLDYYPTGEFDGPSGRMVHGMLVAATRDTVNANIMAAESAGLRPQMVDLSSFALVRALTRGELGGRTAAFVEIGANVTHVVIAAHGTPRFVRMLPSGGQNVTDAVAGALGVTAADAEAIKREVGVGFAVGADRMSAAEAITGVVRPLIEAIRNTFVYYASNNPGAGVEVVVLTGGGAHLPGLGQYLASASRLPVTLGDPLSTLKVAKSVDAARLGPLSSLMSMPIGLGYGVAA